MRRSAFALIASVALLAANAGYPERDWVWQFDGHHLRPIASYRANDAAQVIGVPW